MDVFDSVLPASLFEELRAHVEGKHYRFGWTSGDRSEFDRFFNSQYLAGAMRNRRDVSADLQAQAPGPLWQAWCHLREQHFARTPVLLRAYCNMQLFGVESHPHTDVPPWHVDDLSSVLYCVGDAWQADWGGATVVFEPDGRLRGVLPAANRLVTLRSAQLHQAQPLARHCPVPRFVLVFKFRPPCERHDFFERKNWDRTLMGGRWVSERLWGAGWQAGQMGAPAHVAEAAMFHLAYQDALLGGAAPATRDELADLSRGGGAGPCDRPLACRTAGRVPGRRGRRVRAHPGRTRRRPSSLPGQGLIAARAKAPQVPGARVLSALGPQAASRVEPSVLNISAKPWMYSPNST